MIPPKILRDARNFRMTGVWEKEPLAAAEAAAITRSNAEGIVWQRLLHWRDELGIEPRCRSIELGCGYGKLSMLLGASGATVTLVDSNPAALEAAAVTHRRLGLEPKLLEADLLDLPRDLDGRFDIACSSGTLEHFFGAGREAALRAYLRVLRPGGLLFFVVPNRHAIWYRIGFGLRRRLGGVPEAFAEEPFSRVELLQWADRHALEVLEAAGAGSFRGDFRYWIGKNFSSVIRRLTRRSRTTGDDTSTLEGATDDDATTMEKAMDDDATTMEGAKDDDATTMEKAMDDDATTMEGGKLDGFDPERRVPRAPRSWLDRRFSYSLVFAGRKSG